MHFKKILVVGALLGVCMISTPVGQIFGPTVIYADESQVSYDEEYSLVVIKPEAGGKTFFSYKIDGEYPAYTRDRVCWFNEDGSLKEEKTGLKDTPIFTDDISTWIDVTTDKPRVAQDSDYYNELRKGDCIAVLPYSEVNDTNEFYIPVAEQGIGITFNVVNITDDGTVSDVKEYSYKYSGVQQSEAIKINAIVSSVAKKERSEIITISGDNLFYVQLGSEIYRAKENSVDIELTSNGDYTFIAYADDTLVQETVTYTVDSIKTVIDVESYIDNTAPVITSDMIPTEKKDTAFKFKVYTDENATISCDGVSAEGTELELTIAGNGEYLITATDKAGNYSEKIIVFDCFDVQTNAYKLDRDNQWGINSTDSLTNKLPQTGDLTFASVIAIGVALASAGAVILISGKKKEDKNNADMET